MKHETYVLIFLWTFLWTMSAHAVEVDSPIHPTDSYVLTHPFVPLKRDYSVELGGMWERKSLYWLGASLGFNLGSCFLNSDPNCQGYFDIISGVGGRISETHALLLGSYRWQLIRFPSPWSPFVRVFGGSHVFSQYGKIDYSGAYGVGVGAICYLHDKFDFRTELRLGNGRESFTQAFVGLHLKIDELVEFFASKLHDFGVGAVDVTGKGLKKAGEGIKDAGSAIVSPFSEKEKDSQSEKSPTK